MSAAKYNLTIDQGATFRLTMAYSIDGTPVNLTGYSARMQVRVAYDSETPVLDLTSSNGGITLGGADGTIEIVITAAQARLLPAGRLVYDLELVAPNGDVTRLINGVATVTPRATR